MRLLIITFLIVFSISYSYSQVEIFPNEFVDTFLSTAERDSTPVIQDERITKLVDKHIEYNKQKKGIIGYRIQIYSGVGGPTIKKEASAIRTKFLKLYPDIPVEIIYNEPYFKDNEQNLIEWLRQFSKEPAESYIRGFLGRMLFSGDQPLKQVKFLSGGEKMRCMFSKLMLSHGNTLIIDSPTNHLDLEAIISVNKGLEDYKGAIIVTSHDHNLLQSVCNKVVEIGDLGSFEYEGLFDEFMENMDIKSKIKNLYL
jgi:hypothetical protein